MSTEAIPLSANATETPPPARSRERSRPSTAAAPSAWGMLWFGGWLFTIAFAKLVWWKALLALLVWPYFLGETIR